MSNPFVMVVNFKAIIIIIIDFFIIDAKSNSKITAN